METSNTNTKMKSHYRKQDVSKKLFGLLFIGAGSIWALRVGGVELPSWLYSWGLLLIAIGLINGAKHQFRVGGWLIPTLIGVVFFADEFYPLDNVQNFIWPLVLVAVGFVMFFKPKGRHQHRNRNRNRASSVEVYDEINEDHVSLTTIMAGAEKNVTSNDFKGGDITSILGGNEINFLNADINGTAVLDVTCIMGGSKLTLPANWLVKTEVTSIMGGIEDKRFVDTDSDPSKVLILKGTAIMGGIEIVSH